MRDEDARKPRTGPCDLDRRQFMASLAGLGAAGLGGLQGACDSAPESGQEKQANRSNEPPRVIRVERPSIVEAKDFLSTEQALGLIDALLDPLGGDGGSVAFLKRKFKSNERIGIKLNCLAGRGLSPRPPLVGALIDRLKKAGLEEKNIIIFERTERELKRAGFAEPFEAAPRVQVMGHDTRGAGYEAEPTCYGSIGSCFSKILTRKIDALINFGVLKDHDLAGVSVGLKNLYGLIHNPNKYHDNGCSPYVAHVAASPPVRDKLRLSLCDGLIGQYQGGPALNKSCTWNAGVLLASTDPVALDAVGADIIEAKRKSMNIETLAASGRFPAYLEEAHRQGLGEHRINKIQIVKVD